MSTPLLPTDFPPPRRTGVILQTALALVSGFASGAAIWAAIQQPAGIEFVLLLLLSLVFLFPLGIFLYRAYALLGSSYTLDRDGLRLRWGLRAEDIPLPQIEWVRPASDMGFRMPLPFGALPGGILGTHIVEGLGPVEYIASDNRKLLLIAIPEKIFAISPDHPNAFSRTFQRTIELGSLSPMPSRSALPATFIRRVYSDRAARMLILSGLALTVILFVGVSLLIPTLTEVVVAFDNQGQPLDTTTPRWLLLLPVLATFIYVADLTGGLFFFRNPHTQPVAYLLWSGGIIAPLLLMAALIFMV
ncbi:MAG TPA: PH domain-containing protein [Levilinea sp.]|nr:PH domain-containing protein [Levilinea sp.]